MSKAIKDILSNEKKLNEVAKVAFDSVDTDKSGQIDEQELEKVMAQIASDMGADPPSKEEDEYDEIVEQFKEEINKISSYSYNTQKIKISYSQDWLNKITIFDNLNIS